MVDWRMRNEEHKDFGEYCTKKHTSARRQCIKENYNIRKAKLEEKLRITHGSNNFGNMYL